MTIYVGIDIGKKSHAAGFLSSPLLSIYRRFTACPTLTFQNNRTGFELLLQTIKNHDDQCIVLIEKTGHYGFALEQFLLQQNIMLHKIHVQKRATKRKTDKRDALHLANLLYSQMELGVQTDDKSTIHCVIPPTQAVIKLRTLVQRRTELVRDTTARKNKLTAISDELFPELTEIFADPNRKTALSLRQKYPTPSEIAAASIDELLNCCSQRWPGQAGLIRLQELAIQTIGTHDQARIFSLCLEQKQLIIELHLLQTHIETIEIEIRKIVDDSREGKILTSMPTIGHIQAATLLAHIGNIGNFDRASKLRGYCGWAPIESQSGTTLNAVKLDKGGNKSLKRIIYLIAWSCIHRDTEFKIIYDRLVPIKCPYDERMQKYRGKNKVIGHIAGQMIGVIYTLLRRDFDLLSSLTPHAKLPDPTLYSREIHREHRLHGTQP